MLAITEGWLSFFVSGKPHVQISAPRLAIVSEALMLSYGFVTLSLNYMKLDYNFNIWCYVVKLLSEKDL
jgi:hypothetical protein